MVGGGLWRTCQNVMAVPLMSSYSVVRDSTQKRIELFSPPPVTKLYA